MKHPFNKNIGFQTELIKLERDAARVKMHVLDKSHDATWTDANQNLNDSNLDQVVASESVSVTRWDFGNGVEGEVEVDGWNAFPNGSPGWRSFVNNVSDHCSLYFEIE